MYNYNNSYMNPYGNYYQQPYGAVQPQPQPTTNNNYQGQAQQTQMSNAMPTQQPTYMPLTFVNGIDEVNKFIVSPNASVYLRSNTDNLLFIKSCDSTGKYRVETYELVRYDENKAKKRQEAEKDLTKDFVSTKDFKELETNLRGELTKIKVEVDKLFARRNPKEN